MKKIRKNPDSGEKTGFLCLFPTSSLQFLTEFYKVWFSGVPRSNWGHGAKNAGKIRIPEKNRTQKFFRIFKEIFSMRYYYDSKVFFFFPNTYF